MSRPRPRAPRQTRGRPTLRQLLGTTFAGVALMVAALSLLVGSATSASAHAVFVAASPAPRAQLAHAPTTLRITFSEPLVAALSGVQVDTSTGAAVPLRAAGVDPGDSKTYGAQLPTLRPDRYTVEWHTTSAIDGHTRWGSYVFTVLQADGAAPTAGPSIRLPGPPVQLPTAVQAVTSWAGLAGLFLAAGATLMALLGVGVTTDSGGGAISGVGGAAARRLVGRLLGLALAGATIGVVGQLAATWAGNGWRTRALSSVLTEGAAPWCWLRLAAAVAAVLAWRRGLMTRALATRVLIAATLAMVVSFGASSHGTASLLPVAGFIAVSVHVLAASVWLGGVLALVCVWGLARRNGWADGEKRALTRRFSLVAGAAVPAVVASGAACAVLELGSVADLVRSEYGMTLLAKLVVATAVGGVAAGNAWMHRGTRLVAATPRRAWLGLRAEAGLGLVVLVPTALLSVLGPARAADDAQQATRQLQAAADPASAFTGSAAIGARDLDLSLTPGTAGVNAARVEISGVVGASQVQLRLAGSDGSVSATLDRTGEDHDSGTNTIYQGAVTLPTSGTWRAQVQDPDDASAPFAVSVHPSGAAANATTSPGRLGDWLLVIAVLGGAGMIVGGARALRGRGGRRASLAVGSTCCLAAVAGVGLLATASPRHPQPPAALGVVRQVAGQPAGAGRSWTIAPADAGVMMPAVAPDGSVWIGEMDTDTLTRLRPGDDEIQQIRLTGDYHEIMGVAVDRAGRVWVAEEHAQALGMIDPSTGQQRQYPLPGNSPAPVGVAVDPDGAVWFTAMNGDWIGRLDPASGHITRYLIPTTGALPYWLAVGPGGDVWFTEFGAGKVGQLDPRTGHIDEFALPAGSNPAGIAVAPSGTVWAATIQGRLARVKDGRIDTFPLPAADDYGVAVSTSGTVWVGVAAGGAVYAFDPATATSRRVPLDAKSTAWWLVADGSRVWVAMSSSAGSALAELPTGNAT